MNICNKFTLLSHETTTTLLINYTPIKFLKSECSLVFCQEKLWKIVIWM